MGNTKEDSQSNPNPWQCFAMRHALASLVLALFLFPSIAFGETMDDLVERDGIYYKKFTDVPFTGKVTGEYQGSFKDGKRDGLWVSYYYNGQLKWKGNYKDGKVDGPFVSYWDNGKLQSEGTLKDGKEVGPWFYNPRNGQSKPKPWWKFW